MKLSCFKTDESRRQCNAASNIYQLSGYFSNLPFTLTRLTDDNIIEHILLQMISPSCPALTMAMAASSDSCIPSSESECDDIPATQASALGED